MRRQARCLTGGARTVRSASALQVWLWLLIFVFQNELRISKSIQPGYLDFDNLPDTNFTCAGKVIGGYYADLETSCQMFHVCTVGQQEEPMDIKFLCLNGTVFDQETRVCERVDEVDCTKSEKFYSLNLELYGSTAPPIIQPEQIKPQAKPTEQSHHQPDPSSEEDANTSTKDYSNRDLKPHIQDSTEDTHDPSLDDPPSNHQHTIIHQEQETDHQEPLEENQEIEEEDSADPDYEEDFTLPPPSTTVAPITTSIKSVTTSTRPHIHLSSQPPSPTPPPLPTSTVPTPPSPQIDPALLSPQEFIYRHRGPGSEAISFQRQSYRPADGVYITHAPPQQFDHFQYESSRTAPRTSVSRPSPFAPRPQPTPFHTTTLDPRDQLLRPGPALQPSERHETTIRHRQPYQHSTLSFLHPLPLDLFQYDRKRSDDHSTETELPVAARSAAPLIVTERPPTKHKSPPRVIVTASASVSDSNGKRLNYTVGNVVNAVKPIVPINYDDYKESDLIFDPFFLDVPKLHKRRKTRGSGGKIISINVPNVTRRSSKEKDSSLLQDTREKPTSTSVPFVWNPDDYVDDNYEPHAYLTPVPPIQVLLPVHKKYLKESHIEKNNVKEDISAKLNIRRTRQKIPTVLSARTQITSSQNVETITPSVRNQGLLPALPSLQQRINS